MRCRRDLRCTVIGIVLSSAIPAALAAPPENPTPTLTEVLAAGNDQWGELAMEQPDGPSYEFFEPLLPPPRYVHADFRHYPLVLSAPGAKTKARLISNGSGVNLRGGSRSWKDPGTPVVFRVGPDEFRFGELIDRATHPQPAEGWLPIYEITYQHPSPVQAEGAVPIDQQPIKQDPEVYRLEAFAATDPDLAESAVVFVRFSLAAGSRGIVTVHVDPPAETTFAEGRIVDREKRPVVYLDPNWKWQRQRAQARLSPGSSVALAIATAPLPDDFQFGPQSYEQHRAQAERTWKEIVGRAMQVSVAEPRVNEAWRNLLVQNLMLRSGDRLLYSAGNQYEQLYEGEGSDAVLAMLAWGYEEEARRMLVPLLDFSRHGLEYHQAGIKLQDVVRYWQMTRDTAWVQSMRPRWERELDLIVSGRSPQGGLLPKQRYAGDISTPVHALNVEAQAWRALHDLAPVLREIGDEALAARVAQAEQEAGKSLRDAVSRSVRRESMPPFLPHALLGNEQVHDPITATRIGSYWNLMTQYTIGSRIFPPGSPEENWLPRYLETHGGLCMGMTRTGGTEHGFWTGRERVNPLYGTRYVLDALRRDEPERALVSFYGMLAQGFTRQTLVAGEGSTLAPVDPAGRFFYCPPNSAGNAHFLTILRNLLVQDWDLDDDGEVETLRLLFGTSRRWLADGNSIAVERAPTAFGPVTLRARSRLASGEVLVTADLPTRQAPRRVLLRARVPDGWQVQGASVDGKSIPIDERGTVDLSQHRGTAAVKFTVSRQP